MACTGWCLGLRTEARCGEPRGVAALDHICIVLWRQWRAAGSSYAALVDTLTAASAAVGGSAAAEAAAGVQAAEPSAAAAARVTVRDAVISGFMALG